MKHMSIATVLGSPVASRLTDKSKGNGFTLIELIIVIVILGVLAVTAVPQFFNFSSDARTGTLKGLEGSILTGSDMVYARATLAGVERVESEELELRDVMVPVRYGFPNFVPSVGAPDETAIIRQVQAVFSIEQTDWNYAGDQGTAAFRISPSGVNNNVAMANMASIDSCYVQYTAPPSAGSSPDITTSTTGC